MIDCSGCYKQIMWAIGKNAFWPVAFWIDNSEKSKPLCISYNKLITLKNPDRYFISMYVSVSIMQDQMTVFLFPIAFVPNVKCPAWWVMLVYNK